MLIIMYIGIVVKRQYAYLNSLNTGVAISKVKIENKQGKPTKLR